MRWMGSDDLVLGPDPDGGWRLRRGEQLVGHLALEPQWRLSTERSAWDVLPFGSGWRWAATPAGSDEPEVWLDGGDRALRGATVMTRSGDELQIRGHLLRRVRWTVVDGDYRIVLCVVPGKETDIAIEVSRPHEPLVLLMACLFVVIQGRQLELSLGGGDAG